MRETGNTIRATTIKVGYEGTIAGQTRVLMEAAAEASRQTGALILFHTERGQNVEALIPFFGDRGVPASRLYICHVDKRPDAGLHRALAQAGAAPLEFSLVEAQVLQARDGLPNTFAKLEAGEEVRVAYLGGSITAAPGWRPMTTEWLRESYPRAQIVEIDAAIGGTGSPLGVFRLGQMSWHDPDLLFVEFAVNDSGQDPLVIWRAMEHHPTGMAPIRPGHLLRIHHHREHAPALREGLAPRPPRPTVPPRITGSSINVAPPSSGRGARRAVIAPSADAPGTPWCSPMTVSTDGGPPAHADTVAGSPTAHRGWRPVPGSRPAHDRDNWRAHGWRQ